MPIGYKWDMTAINKPLSYKLLDSPNVSPNISDVDYFAGVPLPYKFALFAEVDEESVCLEDVLSKINH